MYWCSSVEFGISGYHTTIQVEFDMFVATSIYPVMCPFPLTFVALCDYNPSTTQTDSQTDVILVAYGMLCQQLKYRN